MYLINLLEAEHSRSQMQTIVSYIGTSQKKFDDLIKIFLSGQYRLAQRAAWPISNCAAAHPQLINKHFVTLIKMMKDENQHPAVRRNVLRILDNLALIPEKYHGVIMDACFIYISNPFETIACQSFALGILDKLSDTYPEIKPELALIIEDKLPHATAAFKSRAMKILKKKRSNSI